MRQTKIKRDIRCLSTQNNKGITAPSSIKFSGKWDAKKEKCSLQNNLKYACRNKNQSVDLHSELLGLFSKQWVSETALSNTILCTDDRRWTWCSSSHELENWSQVVRDPISHSVPNQNVAVGLPYKLWPARLTNEINSIPPISPIPPFIIRDLPLPAAQMSGFFTVFYSVLQSCTLSVKCTRFHFLLFCTSETLPILRTSWTLLHKAGLYISSWALLSIPKGTLYNFRPQR